MEPEAIGKTLDQLIDGWCERKAISPLQSLLRSHPGVLAHTDQKFQLLESLRDIKSFWRSDLTAHELQLVIEVLNALEDSLSSIDTSVRHDPDPARITRELRDSR